MTDKTKLRSQAWFNNPDNPEMTALYLERYLNYGLTREELQSGKPIIGIAQTGSDLSPCNRHHIELTKRVRDGVIAAGGTVIEIPVHPIQETGKRPTALAGPQPGLSVAWSRSLYGYPIDGVVLNIGCDKTTPALLMAAATVNIPAIALSVGPMLNGWFRGERTGSGTIVWKARELLAAGEIDDEEIHGLGRLVGALDRLLQHHGHRHHDELAWPRRWACSCPAPPRSPRPTASAARSAYAHRQAHRRDGLRGPAALDRS